MFYKDPDLDFSEMLNIFFYHYFLISKKWSIGTNESLFQKYLYAEKGQLQCCESGMIYSGDFFLTSGVQCLRL